MASNVVDLQESRALAAKKCFVTDVRIHASAVLIYPKMMCVLGCHVHDRALS